MINDLRIWLRTKRAQNDHTQAQAAQVVGISRTTWHRWECGELKPNLEQAAEIARWAGCTVDEVAEAFAAGVAA